MQFPLQLALCLVVGGALADVPPSMSSQLFLQLVVRLSLLVCALYERRVW